MVSGKVTVKNPTGLHLRPAGTLCKQAMQFKSSITFHYGDGNTANAKSVLSVLGACVKCGDEIEMFCEGEDEEENTYLSQNFCVGNSLDPKLYIAFQILDYALCSAPGAPLKQALVDCGVGKDVYSIYENGIRQPYFSVVAKDTSVEKEQEFLQVTEEVLKKLVKDGFDEKALLAGINYYEFKYREADFGSYPKGLMYGLQVLDSWLYDDRLPFIHIEANETFAELRGKVKTGYFEGLVQKYLLDNTHRSVVILQPKLGLLEEQEQKQREKMAQVKAAMSPEEIENVKETFQKLTEFQESEDAKDFTLTIKNVTINEDDKVELKYWPRIQASSGNSGYTRAFCTWKMTAKKDTSGKIILE